MEHLFGWTLCRRFSQRLHWIWVNHRPQRLIIHRYFGRSFVRTSAYCWITTPADEAQLGDGMGCGRQEEHSLIQSFPVGIIRGGQGLTPDPHIICCPFLTDTKSDYEEHLLHSSRIWPKHVCSHFGDDTIDIKIDRVSSFSFMKLISCKIANSLIITYPCVAPNLFDFSSLFSRLSKLLLTYDNNKGWFEHLNSTLYCFTKFYEFIQSGLLSLTKTKTIKKHPFLKK